MVIAIMRLLPAAVQIPAEGMWASAVRVKPQELPA
jgi:hypothetical protein